MLLLFIGSITAGVAQNVQEVVYLKNGSIVRGTIIEQVPNVLLKIQTADGSVFAYQMSEVEKITKEQTDYEKQTDYGNRNYLTRKSKSNKRTGYKGFVDLGYTLGVGDWGMDRLEVSTSHGYLFSPYFYAGVGIGVHYYFDSEECTLPIFAHVRSNLLNNRNSPYIDFRIGYTPTETAQGLYMAPSVGYKIGSFNVSLGYVMQKVSIYDDWSENCGGFSIKVGFEF